MPRQHHLERSIRLKISRWRLDDAVSDEGDHRPVRNRAERDLRDSLGLTGERRQSLDEIGTERLRD